MKKIETNFQVAEIIGKLLQGTVTPDEKVLIDDWINENPQNYELYQKLTSGGHLEAGLEKMEKISSETAWQNINNKIGGDDIEFELPARKYKIYRYAAVFIPFVLCFATWVFVKNNSKTPVKQKQSLVVKQTPKIHPGSKQAILQLSDGRTMALGKSGDKTIHEENGAQISNSDNILAYNGAGQSADSKPVYNKVIIPRGGEYQLVLADGTKVWLNSSSSLYYPVQFTGAQREVYLTGEAYFEVAKNKAKPFIVHANENNVQVLGTHFNISAYEDDASVTTTLLEGSVKLTKGNQSAMLIPGEQGSSVKGQSAIKVKTADIEQAMGWKNGYLLFDNIDITSIMKQASRWYDFDVVYHGNLDGKVYSGKISKYKDISELLKNLELTGTIHFNIEGRRIIVMQ